jgi:hypothetical protein
MTLTSTTAVPLSLSDVQTEFTGTPPTALSEYYAGGAYTMGAGRVPSGTTGTYGAVPGSGTISIQNFYGTANVPILLSMNVTPLATAGSNRYTNGGYYTTSYYTYYVYSQAPNWGTAGSSTPASGYVNGHIVNYIQTDLTSYFHIYINGNLASNFLKNITLNGTVYSTLGYGGMINYTSQETLWQFGLVSALPTTFTMIIR